MIVLFIVLLSPSRFVMHQYFCLLHRCRQNLEPGLMREQTVPELELVCTMENCFSTSQTMCCPFARNHCYCQSCPKRVKRNIPDCGLFRCFEDCCLTALDSHLKEYS